LFGRRRQLRAAGRCAIFLSAILSPAAPGTTAAQGTAPAAAAARDPPPPLPRDLLKDPKVIAQGEALWKEQCTLCHGAKAYPGKAPRLQPHRYKPEFVWDRIHNGFRNMPSLKELYSPEQEIAIVAYVLSDEFWP